MKIKALLFATVLLASTSAQAARDIRFVDHGLPHAKAIVLTLGQDQDLKGIAAQIDSASGGALKKALTAAEFTGQDGNNLTLFAIGGYDMVVVLGIGKTHLNDLELQKLGTKVGQTFAEDGPETVSFATDAITSNSNSIAANIALGLKTGSYRFLKYKHGRETTSGTFLITTNNVSDTERAWSGRYAAIDAGLSFARDLVTEPANAMYPERFVDYTRENFKGLKNVRIEALDVDAMRKLNMGGILGVGQGSVRPPRLLIVEYKGGKSDARPIAFVGKGITFDSGGISLKKSDNLWMMKTDMAGAAASVGAVLALAKRNAPVNVVAIAALAENMPDGGALRPGDVVTTMSGKTIEVVNTDAEGRIVLADAVWYAQKTFQPQLMIDLATLTGALRVALGDVYGGLFSRQDDVADQLEKAGQKTGDALWRLPLHDRYLSVAVSHIADLRNSTEQSAAGASIGAEMIGAFVLQSTRWAHIDMAGHAWNTTTTNGDSATGFGVRLLEQLSYDNYEHP